MWHALELKVDSVQALALSDALLEEGALSVDVADALAGTESERPLYGEPGAADEPAFADNRLLALFEAGAPLAEILERACARTGIVPTPPFQTTRVDEQDWVRITQEQFAPIRIAPRLWIVPSWHEPPDPDAINIVLDPGLAFGTGSHPTTRLCLEWLDQYLVPGNSVIDYGCGSGILSIAAARLGARAVTGVDIDPQAVEASRYNALRNGVTLQFHDAEVAQPEPADVVVANILSNPLKVLAPLLADLVIPGGWIVLSGILAAQAGDVADRYRPWFDLDAFAGMDGWVRVSGRRKGGSA
jgi:ribosomal protein L11 methyltransferase